jgi:hypothetical protein
MFGLFFARKTTQEERQMAATVLTVQESSGKYAVPSANGADISLVAIDQSSNGYYVTTGKEMVLAVNSDASPQTITITSQALPTYARTGDITAYSIGAGETALLGPFPVSGWADTNGRINISTSDAAVLVAAIRPSET